MELMVVMIGLSGVHALGLDQYGHTDTDTDWGVVKTEFIMKEIILNVFPELDKC